MADNKVNVKRAGKKSKRNLAESPSVAGNPEHRNEDLLAENASFCPRSPEMHSEIVEDSIKDQAMDDVEFDGLQERLISQEASTTTPGIIYLSRVPELMSVKQIRQIFNEFGEVDRIFLQPDDKNKKQRPSKKNRLFTEGWIEFVDKRVAKRVARALNNERIGGRRRSRWYDELWNMKYLPRFQWTHLNERLAYERAVHRQRLRTEVSQVKREMNHFVQGVEKRNILERIKRKQLKLGVAPTDEAAAVAANKVQSGAVAHAFKQRQTEDAVLAAKRRMLKRPGAKVDRASAALDRNFLKGLFSGGRGSS